MADDLIKKRKILSQDDVREILASVGMVDQAQINRASGDAPFEIQVLNLDLSTAVLRTNPYKINYSFQSIFIRTATSTTSTVSLLPNTEDSFQSPIDLKFNDSLRFPAPLAKGRLFWSAQAGATMQIILFKSGEIRPGSQVSVVAGGFSISDGDTATDVAVFSATTVAAIAFAADTTRKVMHVTNLGSAPIFLGSALVTDDTGGFPGVKVEAGEMFRWQSTAACYIISKTGVQPVGLLKMS